MKKSFRYCWLIVLIVWILIIVWAFTADGPDNPGMPYGATVTVTDQGAADLYNVDGPGIYVGDNNGRALEAFRGGLGMLCKGIVTFNGDLIDVGWRGISRGIFNTLTSIIVFIIFCGTLIYIILSFRKKKRVKVLPAVEKETEKIFDKPDDKKD